MSIGIKISVDATRYGGFSAAALAYRASIIANGGTIPDATLAILDANFITPNVINGNWAKIVRLNFWAGLSGYQIAANTCAIRTNIAAVAVNSPTFDNTGYKFCSKCRWWQFVYIK
jgi:hypothetical protein